MTITIALRPHDKNKKVAFVLLAVLAFMIGLSYASVPLYRLFCEKTGFGGTTRKSSDQEAMTSAVSEARVMQLDFNTDIAPNLPWTFKPLQQKVEFKVGEPQLIFFEIHNKSNKPISGNSTFNVTPHEMGAYFVKTECFCYQEQTLAPNETVKLPVSFYIDPEIMNDKDLKDRHNVTLSYSFFKSPETTTTSN